MVRLLVPMLEAFLAERATSEKDDRVRQGSVLYMGALAKHIAPDDPKIVQVVHRLFDALGTPSEQVQRTISISLAGLVGKPAVKPQAAEHVSRLLDTLLGTDSYAERRGAAFGLAGVVKGLGIPTLKSLGVMARLQEAVESKAKGEATANAREGALQAYECLAGSLGRLFEPYVITILPLLLTCVADTVGAVRHAAVVASQKIMSQLSAQGVKMVLPSLLRSLEEDKWRTKHAAVELLGSMAYCAPKQLANTLPQVVPALTEHALTASHPRVKEGANAALASVGAVIKNPEIARLVPTLLKALSDPGNATPAALNALAHCQFEHCVDPPSLALIVPVLHRGLRERAAQAKRKTAHIAGNMCSLLSDRQDIVPYLPLLLPELQAVLIDPIPEVRSTGAKALGRLCAGLGEEQIPQLLPWLLEALCSDGAAVERAGAAQGLAEVLCALGEGKLRAMMPELRDGCQHAADPSAREGYALLWVHLPVVLGAKFEPFLPDVLPLVLLGLADDTEPVRDASMRAAQSVIAAFREVSAGLLLPELQRGLTHQNYRIRQSSAELLGDLMLRLTNKEPMPIPDPLKGEDNAPDSPLASVPVPQQHEMLAALYIARSDATIGVKQAAHFVWKTLVANAPKALRIILPELTQQLIAGLSSEDEELQQAAARALGELVGKLAERVLPTLIPILQQGLQTGDAAHRQGVCLGLSELMSAAGRESVSTFLPQLIAAVRTGLCDAEQDVRQAAAGSFKTLERNIGTQAVQEIAPALLQLMRSADASEVAQGQSGLRELVSQRPGAVVPFLLPRLSAAPVSLPHARALTAVASVAGAALHTHLDVCMPALLASLFLEAELAEAAAKPYDVELRDALLEAASTVALAVEDDGMHFLVSVLAGACAAKSAAHVRVGGATLLGLLCKESSVDLSEYLSSLLTMAIGMLSAESAPVLRAGHAALDTLVKGCAKERYPLLVPKMREQVTAVADEHRAAGLAAGAARGAPCLLPGLCLPKGLGPLQAVYLQGLMTGTPELREAAAEALGEAIELTSAEALKPFVIQITGPLIRIVGDRFASPVKAAILGTLALLIGKGQALLKPFVPQLQTTCVKSLQDGTKLVRMRAAAALMRVAALSTRIEPLLNDLHNQLLGAESGVQHALLCALGGVLRSMTKPVGEAVLGSIREAACGLLCGDDPELCDAAAYALGGLARWAAEGGAESVLGAAEEASQEEGEVWKQSRAQMRVHLALLRHDVMHPGSLGPSLSAMYATAAEAAAHEKMELRQLAAHSLARVGAAMARPEEAEVQAALAELQADGAADADAEGEMRESLAQAGAVAVPAPLAGLLAGLLVDSVLEVRASALHACKTLARLAPSLLRAVDGAVGRALLPGIVNSCKDKRHMQVQTVALRALVHVLGALGWAKGDTTLPRSLDSETASFVADFAGKKAQRLANTDSDAERSDVDPCN